MTVTEKSLMMVYILFSLCKNMFPGKNYLMLLEVTKPPQTPKQIPAHVSKQKR